MTRLKWNLTGNRIALLALALSVVSSGASIYQWWDSGRQDRIRAAIELSNKYVEQHVNALQLRQQWAGGTSDYSHTLLLADNQDARLEYVAFLANRGYVNSDYLSQRLLCDMAQSDGGEEQIFNKRHSEACESTDKQ